MGLADLESFLRRHGTIGLDTAVFIYQLESNPRYVALTDRIFAWIERPDHRAITSAVTMTELLVDPYRTLDQGRVDDIYGLLSTVPHLEWIAPDLQIADLAARIRALHRLRTPDALQAATAIRGKATALVTNDSAFERVQGIETFVLERACNSSGLRTTT